MVDTDSDFVNVQLNIDDNRWCVSENFFIIVSKKIFEHIGLTKTIEISFLLTNDKHITQLNKMYRNKATPTNVLSFPLPDASVTPQPLGDVVLSYDTLMREVAESKYKSFDDHLTHLVVHGVLHLLGYDHENDEEAQEMESLEIQILNDLSIANPYREI